MSGKHRARTLHSIRWRFTLWISALLIASVGVAFAIIYRDTGARLGAQIDHDLAAETAQLLQSLQIVQGEDATQLLGRIHAYTGAQPFRSLSTLLFVLVPGRQPVSNYPELFVPSRPEQGETMVKQAAENALARRIGLPALGRSERTLPDVGPVALLERPIDIGGLRLVIGAGEPLTTLSRAQRGVVHSFLLAGAFIALAVLLGTYLVGTRVTAPLRRMARVAARVDAGDLEPRMEVDAARRDEVGVLATAFNHMLTRLDAGFRGQREFIADASHELRTPLTVIQGQLEVLANRREPDRAEVRRVQGLVSGEIGRMRRIVDDLLLLAQAERPDFFEFESFDLPQFIDEIWDGASLIAARRFELGPVTPGRLRADPDRIAQAIRNLINNAIDHSEPETGRIRLQVDAVGPDSIAIELTDDGPGVPADQLERIFHRFHRARPRGASGGLGGAGLGLSIVRAITEAHGGKVHASNPAHGSGARFVLVLPGFQPAPAGDAGRSRPPTRAGGGA